MVHIGANGGNWCTLMQIVHMVVQIVRIGANDAEGANDGANHAIGCKRWTLCKW